MKLSRLILMFFICAACSTFFPFTETPNADQKYAVVISADASDTEEYAAQFLSEYLSALDGNYYPVIRDNQSFEGYKFCIGDTSFYDTSDMMDKAADSYCIAPFHNGLAIYGSGTRGTVYGVCSFLEDFCGYRCYTPESGMVTTAGKMVLPEEKIEYNPYFEYRNTDWRSGWSPLYSLVNKLNGDLQGGLTNEQGGFISYLGNSCHTLSTMFCSADIYFDSHPEYFAQYEGKRVPYQLCLTNDDVYNIVLNEVLRTLKYSHDPGADLQIISLSQADNTVYCQCDTCKALDRANGSQAGSLITFVNRIARAVKEKGYDNVEFDTLAYMHTRKAPSAVVPEDNVIVRLCTFECCFSHPMDDIDCQNNRELINDLDEWSEICNNLYIWDYTTNYAYTLGIFPDFHVLQKNLQCFYEHGVKGVYEEGNYYVYLCDTEFGDLRTYLIAKLLEDPYCDYDAEMLNFCSYYYGDGGKYLKTAIDEITDHTKGHVTIYSRMTESFSIDDKEAEEIDHLWNLTENAARSSDALKAIKRSKLSWRYVKAALGLREFSGTLEENRDERESLYNDLIAHDVMMIDEWTSIEQDFSEYELIPIEEWEYAGRYYYLKYDLNGGKEGPSNEWCFSERIWIPYIIPTRPGYQFLGWAMEKDSATVDYHPGDFIYLSSDVILYAVWERNTSEIIILTHPKSRSAAEGTMVRFFIEADGDDLNYQWQYRTGPAGSWNDSKASGNKTAEITFTAKYVQDGYQYRCKVSNSSETVYTNEATLTVTETVGKPEITTQPESKSAAEGSRVEFSIEAAGDDLGYQWQYRTSPDGPWKKSNATGNKTEKITFISKPARDGYQYRCRVSNNSGNVYTNEATLTVTPAAPKPEITTHPESVSAAEGATVEFAIEAAGDDLGYQWQYRTSPDGSWKKSNASGDKTAKITFKAKSERDGYQYRCKVSNSGGAVYTNEATLTVTIQ